MRDIDGFSAIAGATIAIIVMVAVWALACTFASYGDDKPQPYDSNEVRLSILENRVGAYEAIQEFHEELLEELAS